MTPFRPLSKFAIHTTRKRMIGVQRKLKADGQGYRAFEIFNLGKYEWQHFVGVNPNLGEEWTGDFIFENEWQSFREIVDAAIAVHRELGPGLLETVYPNERFLGDFGGLARENPDSNQSMHQIPYTALRPLVMMSFANDHDLTKIAMNDNFQ